MNWTVVFFVVGLGLDSCSTFDTINLTIVFIIIIITILFMNI